MSWPRQTLALVICVGLCLQPAFAQTSGSVSPPPSPFDRALARFVVDHDRTFLRKACNQALLADPKADVPLFYLAVLDEADENWKDALAHFNAFLASSSNSDLSHRARVEIAKLPRLIQEDSTPTGKVNREYRTHLAIAEMLFKRGFAREALLETGAASKLLPNRWEAYAAACSILLSQHDLAGANHFYVLAEKYVPQDAIGKLHEIRRQLEQLRTSPF